MQNSTKQLNQSERNKNIELSMNNSISNILESLYTYKFIILSSIFICIYISSVINYQMDFLMEAAISSLIIFCVALIKTFNQ